MTEALHPPAHGPDPTLLAAVRAGDARAFRTLYRRETPGLHRLALRLTGGAAADAEDVVQETWHRAVRGLAGFEGRSTVTTWLKSILVRCALEARTIRGKHAAAPLEEECTDGRPPDGGPEGTAVRMDLERAFERLSPGFRTVLVLHDVEGYRHRDIAELLGISDGTSKSQLARARARLREALGDDYGR